MGEGVAAPAAAAVGADPPAEEKLPAASAAPVHTLPADASVWVGMGVAATAADPVVTQPTDDNQVLAITTGEAANGNQSSLPQRPPTCRRLTLQWWWSRLMRSPPPPSSAGRQSATTRWWPGTWGKWLMAR